MALHIELKPFELFNLNGAEVRNGPQRVRFQILSGARFLREKDIMLEQEATTAAKRLYFALQGTYLNNDWHETGAECLRLFAEAAQSCPDNTRTGLLAQLLADGDLYRSLKTVDEIIRAEEQAYAASAQAP